MATELLSTIIPAVAEINHVNDFVLRRVFATPRFFETAEVQYDLAQTTKESAGFNSFVNEAKIVEKDGFKKVILNPFAINEKTIKNPGTAGARGFSQPQFGGGDGGDAELESELEDFGKLRARAKRLEVKTAYEAMTTGKIVYGQDGIPEIVFGMPNDNIETVTNLWSDQTNGDPVADMIAAYDAMSTKPDAVILGYSAYQAFRAHPKVHTERTSDGKSANVEAAAAADVGKEGRGVIFVGRLVERPLEIYCDMSVASVDGTDEYLLDGKKVVYAASGAGERLYGGVPVAPDQLAAIEFAPLRSVQDDPAQTSYIYRSRPLPTLKNPYGFYCQQVLS